jgi:excisionase family DNA binding protein
MKTPSAVFESPLLSIEEASRYLRVARSTFVSSVLPRIPQVRVTRGRVFFHLADLDAYVDAQRRDPPP